MGLDLEQQPGDGTRRQARVLGDHFAKDFAAIETLPGGAGIVAGHLLASREQLGLRSLEGPLNLAGVALSDPALVDLDADGLPFKRQHLAGRGLPS